MIKESNCRQLRLQITKLSRWLMTFGISARRTSSARWASRPRWLSGSPPWGERAAPQTRPGECWVSHHCQTQISHPLNYFQNLDTLLPFSNYIRDPRGFAVKFYTEEGNWDLVGNNTPIFFIRYWPCHWLSAFGVYCSKGTDLSVFQSWF